MTTFGGDLSKSSILSKILSIGYEFETHEMSKLSFENNEFVNSDLTMRLLKNVAKEKVDPSTFKIRMIKSARKYDEHDEYVIEPEHDGFGINYETPLYITNDKTTDTEFEDIVRPMCEDLSRDKNKLYTFKEAGTGKEIPIKFVGTLNNENCGEFGGVEFIVTYLHPVTSENIIMETFTDACKRILDHLNSLVVLKGEVVMDVTKKYARHKKLESVNGERVLLHKPGTNLFYLQRDDMPGVKADKALSHRRVVLYPQVTFKTKAEDYIDVCRQLANFTDKQYNQTWSDTRQIKWRLYDIVMVDKFVVTCIDVYNNGHAKKIDGRTRQLLETYFFIIMYKVFCYIVSYLEDTEEGKSASYLKDYLPLASRHGNDVVYQRVVEILKKEFNISSDEASGIIIDILNNRELLSKYIYASKRESAIDGSIDIDQLSEEENGDPGISFLSYLKFLEEQGYDWFEELDAYSTRFDLKDDEVLAEYRMFAPSVELTAKTNRLRGYGHSLKDMESFVKQQYAKKTEKLGTKIYNPSTEQFVKKCPPKQMRDENFKCQPILKTRNKQIRLAKKAEKEAKKAAEKAEKALKRQRTYKKSGLSVASIDSHTPVRAAALKDMVKTRTSKKKNYGDVPKTASRSLSRSSTHTAKSHAKKNAYAKKK